MVTAGGTPVPTPTGRKTMGFGDAVKSVFSKYATFSGRARRSELWFWALFLAVVAVALSILVNTTGGLTIDLETMAISYGATYWIASLVNLALLLPGIAVTVRRLHDTDRSGFWWFIGLVPLAGPIVLLVFTVQDGTPGDNRFGPSPKAVAAPVPAAV
jgi:uncharacterized membrane protein YhaH (DUF805 family)